ncbi:MAG: helix-turn-helix transcriptional regulator [Clostridia bacterium]|nr:helix-turn-helix transcriptional regulator [Clostridia bacterium]
MLAFLLRYFRYLNNLTAQEVADALGVRVQRYKNWERNKTYPDLKNFFKIAEFYNYSLNAIYNDIKNINNLMKIDKQFKIIAENLILVNDKKYDLVVQKLFEYNGITKKA